MSTFAVVCLVFLIPIAVALLFAFFLHIAIIVKILKWILILLLVLLVGSWLLNGCRSTNEREDVGVKQAVERQCELIPGQVNDLLTEQSKLNATPYVFNDTETGYKSLDVQRALDEEVNYFKGNCRENAVPVSVTLEKTSQNGLEIEVRAAGGGQFLTYSFEVRDLNCVSAIRTDKAPPECARGARPVVESVGTGKSSSATLKYTYTVNPDEPVILSVTATSLLTDASASNFVIVTF